MDEEQPVTAPRPRQPRCTDCTGQGVMQQPRARLVRHGDGSSEMISMLVPARCPNCRGTGKAGV